MLCWSLFETRFAARIHKLQRLHLILDIRDDLCAGYFGLMRQFVTAVGHVTQLKTAVQPLQAPTHIKLFEDGILNYLRPLAKLRVDTCEVRMLIYQARFTRSLLSERWHWS